MKTGNYNFEKVLLTILFSVSLSVYSYASRKGHEISSSSKTTAVPGSLLMTSSNNKMETLTETFQKWMENGSYWEEATSDVASTDKLAEEMEDWLSKGSFWNEQSIMSGTFDNLADTLKTWLKKASYWNEEVKELLN